jgi:hypothetical protein
MTIPGGPPPQPWWREGSTWTLLILMGFAGGLLWSIIRGFPAVGRFADPAYARGVITFVISLATICIAFVIVFQAFFGDQPGADDRFRRAREVFSGLMGVLGTIVGFYFGSTTGARGGLEIAEPKLEDTRLTTFVSGGQPPYHYVVMSGKDTVGTGESSDGWIEAKLKAAPKAGDTLSVTVSDRESHQAVRRLDLPGTEPAPASIPSAKPDSQTHR